MSHNTNFYAYVYGQGSNGLYYRAEDTDGDGKVELYGSGDYGAYVVVSATNYMPYGVYGSIGMSGYGSGYGSGSEQSRYRRGRFPWQH